MRRMFLSLSLYLGGLVMPIKILIVDDSAVDRLAIKKALNGYLILTAGDGVEALRILEEHDGIDLLILDLNMPKMDGFQVLEALKKDKRFQKLRTIVLTGYDELKNEIKSLKLGAVDYIRKPIHKDLLKVRIDLHAALIHAQRRLERQLDEQALALDMIFDQAPIGIAISYNHDPEQTPQTVIRINSMFEQIIGRTKEELNRLGWPQVTNPDELKEDIKNFKQLLSGKIKMYSMDKRYIRPDGSIVWIHMIVAPLKLANDQQSYHICLVQDITGRKTMEEALHESERSKSVFLSHLPGLAYRCNYDRDWTMQYVSEGCFSLTGYPPESLLYNRDLSYNEIIAPEYRETLWDEWKRILAKREPFKYEYEIITATGERKWVLELGQGIYNEQGEVEALEGLVLDISDRKAMEDTLKYNSEHDSWTGLYNRNYLVSFLEKETKEKGGTKKALIGINLSSIQLFTINYGFQYTQNLIRKVAEALSRHCTDDRLLFQPREDRFIFYLQGYKDKNELVAFSKAIVETLGAIFVTDRIPGGIGILEIGQDQSNVDPNLLLRRLLIASEKSSNLFGKDFEFCFYDDELEALIDRERDIVEALNMIVAEDYTGDELYLQYQPVLDLRTGLVCGFEALARLNTEKLGFVSPAEFIPIAEE